MSRPCGPRNAVADELLLHIEALHRGDGHVVDAADLIFRLPGPRGIDQAPIAGQILREARIAGAVPRFGP